jgi:hypothetical protein
MELTYKVKQEDLVGQLLDFPIEVVQKMVERQVEQGNKPDVTIFQKDCRATRLDGGFTWEPIIEGDGFWYSVIAQKRFDQFFERYPKGSLSKKVYIWGHPTKGNKVIEALKERGGIDRGVGYAGNRTDSIYYIDPITSDIGFIRADSNADRVEQRLFNMVTTYHEKIEIKEDEVLELTLDEIAKKFGVDVEKLKIKK